MKSWTQFIADISIEDHKQIIADYRVFRRDGFIEDCLLRDTSMMWLNNLGAPAHSVAQIIDDLAKHSALHLLSVYNIA